MQSRNWRVGPRKRSRNGWAPRRLRFQSRLLMYGNCMWWATSDWYQGWLFKSGRPSALLRGNFIHGGLATCRHWYRWFSYWRGHYLDHRLKRGWILTFWQPWYIYPVATIVREIYRPINNGLRLITEDYSPSKEPEWHVSKIACSNDICQNLDGLRQRTYDKCASDRQGFHEVLPQ